MLSWYHLFVFPTFPPTFTQRSFYHGRYHQHVLNFYAFVLLLRHLNGRSSVIMWAKFVSIVERWCLWAEVVAFGRKL